MSDNAVHYNAAFFRHIKRIEAIERLLHKHKQDICNYDYGSVEFHFTPDQVKLTMKAVIGASKEKP